MALRVGNAPAQPKLTVRNSNSRDGLGTQTYNPQPASPRSAQILQPTYNPAPKTYSPQKTAPVRYVQPAATAQQIAAAAARATEQVRIAQAAEVARQQAEAVRIKEENRSRVQGQVNSRVAGNKQALQLRVQKGGWSGRLTMGKILKTPRINVPDFESDEYDEAYRSAYDEALKEYDQQRKGDKKGLSKLWDKVSFGQDRRDLGAREYAEKRAGEVATKNVGDYDNQLNGFLAEQAKKKAAIENSKFKTKAEFDKAVSDYTTWESANISNLEKARARTTAQLEAFGKAAEKPLSSAASKAVSWATKVPETNRLFKYTLGGGSEGMPSIVTAPSRAVNWLGNLNTKDRTINQYGGTSTNRAQSGKTAWQASFNQRNFNIRPVVDKPYDKDAAFEKLKKGDTNGSIQQTTLWQNFKRAKSDKEKEEIAKKFWDEQNRAARNQNSAQEFVADPLFMVKGVTGASKALGWTGKAAKAGRASKATGWAFKAADAAADVKKTIGNTKAFKWLGAEAKSPEEQLSDAIASAKNTQRGAIEALQARVASIDKKLTNGKIDLSVFDDFKTLTDSEAKMLQRMVDGKMVVRDRLMLMGRNNAPTRAKLEGIAKKWQDFAEKMRLADDVKNTRFGQGKKTYSPRTAWLTRQGKELDEYNFKLRKRSKGTQNADDFRQGAIDRYFKSSIDEVGGKKASRLVAERKALLSDYDTKMTTSRADVEKAFDKTQSWTSKARRVAGTPTRIWKKSVLKYRPAWTVNNVLYNTQAGVLASGAGSLGEQAKMLNPRYWRKAMDESRSTFGGNIGKEIGKKGKLDKFYNNVEDWSRVAAGRAAMKKGLTAEQATKRVNKYLFDYTTKNWERPIKAVVPFWQFQKNVAKAAVTMPADRPLAAAAYNRLDRYQQSQYEKDFNSVVPKLTELGYSTEEIEAMRAENAKYFKGRLKVGGKYWTTPFNAMSEKGLSNIGINPYLAAAGETAEAVDSFGTKIKGKKAGWRERLVSKFPQADLALQGKRAYDIQTGKAKPKAGWIGEKGHEGYGLSKERQGYDKNATNYDSRMDLRRKLGDNALALLGKPRDLTFNKDDLIRRKTLQKAKDEYFKTDWDAIEDYNERTKKQTDLLKKFGLTPDEFFKSELAKNDSPNTKQIKVTKEEARKKNTELFAEYAKQPYGTRSSWAAGKLKELNAAGYFDKNPFLKSFDWLNPETIAKANTSAAKRKDYEYAMKTGDWSRWRAKYGVKSQKAKDYMAAKSSGDWTGYTGRYGKTAKAQARDKAVSSGDWSAYEQAYGTSKKTTPYQHSGKYFKSAESMKKYVDGEFWRKFATADKADKKRLLAENPEYDTRKDWTADQWLKWRAEDKRELNKRARAWGSFGDLIDINKAANNKKAAPVLAKKQNKRMRKIVWQLS